MKPPTPERSQALLGLLPSWHFAERHERVVAATPGQAYEAFRALSLRELPLSRVLFAIRSAPSRLTGGIALPTSSRAPLLDLMLDAGFLLLLDDPGRELVVGVVEPVTGTGAPGAGRRLSSTSRDLAGDFVAYDRPGAVKIAMTLLFTELGAGRTEVFTETRVLATDEAARRRFSLYWLGIRTFSGLIRLEWLRAIERRAAHTARR